ncbi:MAG: hypothetical protein P1P85_05730 [Patescibacteria group bacterium]|nr:hypothetical protein [Patescibacteria group bacterium]
MDYIKKKKEIEEKFNATKTQLEQVNLQAKGLSEELARLQGEHRLLESLEKENSETPKK